MNSTFSTTTDRIKTSIVYVTPAMAKRWLTKNTSNRNVSWVTVERYRRDMEAGLWHLTHEGIGFDTDGSLTDGQHRLHAIALLPDGASIPMQITTGLDPEAKFFVDQGRKRNAGGQLQIAKVKNATATAAGARFYLIWKQGILFRDTKQRQLITAPQIQDWVDENPVLVNLANENHTAISKSIGVPSVARAAFYAVAQIDASDAEVFFGRFHTGAGLDSGDPILALRTRLETDIRKNRKRGDREQLGWFVMAWNDWRAGRSRKSFASIQFTSANFPEPK